MPGRHLYRRLSPVATDLVLTVTIVISVAATAAASARFSSPQETFRHALLKTENGPTRSIGCKFSETGADTTGEIGPGMDPDGQAFGSTLKPGSNLGPADWAIA